MIRLQRVFASTVCLNIVLETTVQISGSHCWYTFRLELHLTRLYLSWLSCSIYASMGPIAYYHRHSRNRLLVLCSCSRRIGIVCLTGAQARARNHSKTCLLLECRYKPIPNFTPLLHLSLAPDFNCSTIYINVLFLLPSNRNIFIYCRVSKE